MYDNIDPDELPDEERFELEAAFGKDAVENGDLVRIDVDQLDPVESTMPQSFDDVDEVEYDGELTVGDEVTVRFMSGTEYTGTVESTRDFGFSLVNDEEPGAKILSYEDFQDPDKPGITHELLEVVPSDEGASDVQQRHIEIYQADFDLDRESNAFQIARDIRSTADPDLVYTLNTETFNTVYECVFSGDVDLSGVVDPESVSTVVGHVRSRRQGGRVDEELDYDGTEERSMMMGDIVAVDGRAYLIGAGSTPDLGDLEYLTGDTAH